MCGEGSAIQKCERSHRNAVVMRCIDDWSECARVQRMISFTAMDGAMRRAVRKGVLAMRSPTGEEFAHLTNEVKQMGDMLAQLIELVGTLGAEMREGFRKQGAEMHSIRDELRSEIGQGKTELQVGIEALRHDIQSERRARGHWQAETEYRISSLELRWEDKAEG